MNAAQKHAAAQLESLRETRASRQRTIEEAEASIVSLDAQIAALGPIANPPVTPAAN